MKIIGIIPARYNSSRFPGKPLIDIDGMTMIHRVYNQVKHASKISEVIVATDDNRIMEEVRSFAGNVVMTSPDHLSGTDRCAEVLSNVKGFEIAINIQGDEPFIDPLQIDLLCSCFENDEVEIATLIKKISSESELFNPNRPKVVIDKNNNALYFSRHPIPYQQGMDSSEWISKTDYYAHIGIYGYKVDTLKNLTQLPSSHLEKTEGLEQLRWLENGYRIATALSDHDNDAIDTPDDLVQIKQKYRL